MAACKVMHVEGDGPILSEGQSLTQHPYGNLFMLVKFVLEFT